MRGTQWAVAVTVVALAAVGATVVARGLRPARPSPDVPLTTHPVPLETSPASALPPSSDQARARATWERLAEFTATEQEAYLTSVMEREDWSLEMRDGLFRQLKNRRLTPLARNNLAIGLLRNHILVADMEDALLVMADDPQEDSVWREYTVQFLSVCAEQTGASSRSIGKLQQISQTADDPRAATAALHLHRLSTKSLVTLGAEYDNGLVARLARQDRPPAEQATVIGILGSRRVQLAAPALRVAVSAPEPTVRRAAYAALGELRNSEDRDLVRGGLTDKEELVVKAAQVALSKLEAP